MLTRTIEIDFEVHQAIELERTGFDESANDALRRLLGLRLAGSENAPNVHNAPVREGKPWSGKGALLPHGTELRMQYRGQLVRGRIDDGTWLINGKRSTSPSDAARNASLTKEGKHPSLNGWNYWEVKRPQDGQWRKLKSLRT